MDVKLFDEAAAVFPDVCFEKAPDIALILGSGWGDVLQKDNLLFEMDYSVIPHLGAATVMGHAGVFYLYEYSGKRVAAFCGRRHYYEGVGWESVVMGVELARRMGIAKILLTNASGGINPALKPGDLVIISDHVNTVGLNPLIGPHREVWGTRFPDLTEIYTQHARDLLLSLANRIGIRAMCGTYGFTSGPVYETPAEIRAYAHMGIDVVGMSTVPEAVFAHACGMQVAGISFVANLAAGIAPHPLRHTEIMAAAQITRPNMAKLLNGFLRDF